LAEGNFDSDFFKQWWTQISKFAQIKDVKKRILDILNAAGYKIEESDLRLWVYNLDDENSQNTQQVTLEERCGEIKNALESVVEVVDENEETNSGVSFPGSSLE
jgi:hypothetical protein